MNTRAEGTPQAAALPAASSGACSQTATISGVGAAQILDRMQVGDPAGSKDADADWMHWWLPRLATLEARP